MNRTKQDSQDLRDSQDSKRPDGNPVNPGNPVSFGEVPLYLESLRFANREVERTGQRMQRAIAHRELVSELQIEPAVALANHHCRVAAGNLRGALNKRGRELRNL